MCMVDLGFTKFLTIRICDERTQGFMHLGVKHITQMRGQDKGI